MIPAWADPYVGLPYRDKGRAFDGVDCYGLVRLIYLARFNINLPSYDDAYLTSEHGECAIDEHGLNNDSWIRITTPIAGAVVVLLIGGKPNHVGVMLDETKMIHSLKGHDSAIEDVTRIKWRSRIKGFFIHV